MKKLIPLLMLVLFSTTLNAQNNYSNLWDKVHGFEIDNLPKSALKIVDEIYAKATKDNNSPQLVKCLLYKSKFMLILEENAQLKVVNQFKEHISKSSFPTKNVLENILAKIHWQYFNQHRWQFYDRTKTQNKVDNNDFRTWDLNTLFAEIQQYYKASLSNKEQLQNIDIYKFGDILHVVKGSKELRPTLYDLLANNALEFYKTDENNITKPAYQFKIEKPDLLSDASTFSTIKLTTKDTLSLQFNALKIYQELSAFHLQKNNLDALADIDLQRLEFVKQHATFTNKEELYLKALITSKNKYKKNEISGLYAYEIAKIYNDQAISYQENEKHRFKNKEALEICNEIIKQFPDSVGAIRCTKLKSKITSQELNLLTENYSPINKHSRVLVTYKNIDKLYFTVYKINTEQRKKLERTYNEEEKIKLIKKLPVIKNWSNYLRNEHDYLSHKTEIIVPPLPNNDYLIVASEKDGIDKETLFGTALIQITDLVLIEAQLDGKETYQVVNRNNGSPIRNAKIHLKNYNVNQRYNKPINKTLTTNKEGFASYKSTENHGNIVATVSTENDWATFGNYYINKYRKDNDEAEDENIQIKPFIFTDRSIYRPGQTVYFKAIFIQRKGETSTPFTNEFVKITLKDVNRQKVEKIEVKLNEFGSASGKFILPNNGLTGEYSFSIDESEKEESKFYDEADFNFTQEDYIHSISVEEYKRPKFETEFSPITETFKVDDSVTVKGFAKAFSGANVTDAKVVYRVHRKVRYPNWWYWYRPSYSSEPQEIKNGEITTDASGNFTIKFKALVDESVDKKSLPIFSYEVTADVTDINGETRSATTVVKVGYHALTATITLPEKIDVVNKKETITINTQNLNGEFVPAKGTVKVYKLQAPQKPLRKRPWNAPDYQDITEEEFRKLFPHDSYSEDETDEKNWKKGNLIFETNFDTSTSKEITLKRLKRYLLGKYVVVLETKDKFDQDVKEEARFTLINSDKNVIADSELFFIRTDKPSYKVGEKAKIILGSASKDITIMVLIEKDYKIVNTELITLSNNVKTLTIPVKKDDLSVGGFAIKYYYVNYNKFNSGNFVVPVTREQKNILIETNTFRDKLQPGDNQTWSFTIKNDDKDKVAAEVLASMYDASLDQFKSHSWSFNPIEYRSYYSYRSNVNAYQSFGNKRFRIFNRKHNYGYHRNQEYDRLNWFGFDFSNNKWKQRRYVQRLKEKIESQRTSYDKILTGVVQDENGPLPGVNVLIKGTSFGTETNFDGKYAIKVKKGDVLVFSYVGMETKEFTVGNSSKKDIVLEQGESTLDEVVVIGYGTTTKKSFTGTASIKESDTQEEATDDVSRLLSGKVTGVEVNQTGSTANITIRGYTSLLGKDKPLFVVDGVPVNSFHINTSDIYTASVLKGESATSLYGEKAKNGVIIITTKTGQAKLEKELAKVQTRKNLQETAFFYPHLTTDKKGNVSFNFTVPEALTRWKLNLLAHTKELQTARKTLQTVTQKELMVVPNAPRFLRQGDTVVLSAKISNLSDKTLQGLAQLQLTDAVTGKELNLFSSSEVEQNQNFTVDKNGNTNVSWQLSIPDNVNAVQYKVVAKAGDFSDGEQNALPVLTNRTLVTETVPLWVRSNQTKTFSLDKLKSNNSSTLKNHKLTLEVTSNPAWYAVQALPYLMEYPYECSEQTFSRYYANTLATHIANSNPKIQEVFNYWKSSDALLSNLEKNQELKSLIIQETPWLRDAQSETEQKKRIALLFDLTKMSNEQTRAINKLTEMQMSSGGFPWFKGSNYPNPFITNHIATGFGHLQKLGVKEFDTKTEKIITKSIKFLDEEIADNYNKLLDRAEIIRQRDGEQKAKEFLTQKHIGYFELQYLYMRSFYTDVKISSTSQKAVAYYKKQSAEFWNDFNLYGKGMIALLQHRTGNKSVATKVLKSLKENSITSEELGMYWKENQPSWYWYQSPIETQALLIEAFSEIENNIATVDNLKIWLLKNKQVSRWKTTKATSEAVYALLLQGSDWISTTDLVDIQLGDITIDPTKMPEVQVEAGTGYFKTSWNGNEITPKMGEVTLKSRGKTMAWGGLYWQYFEDLDKITSAETPLQLKKKLFKKVNSDTGKELIEVTDSSTLKVGDLLTVRIELRADRNMEFIHMKDMRASGVEPVNVLSKYKWQDGLGYYESTKDASTNFFFDRLPKGVYIFEYDVRVNNAGNFSNGITTIESMYAPEFKSHSEGVRISVE